MSDANPPPHTPSHPALSITNISTFIRTPLTDGKGLYTTWAELFKNHARAFLAIDHIIPSLDDKSDMSSSVMKQKNPGLWDRVDAIVLQWIYGTISDDLIENIIGPNLTASSAWNRLEELFSNNKTSRALYLRQELSNVKMESFDNASSYCQHLKLLSDQLRNVGVTISNEDLVLQLISGLTDAYETLASQLRHSSEVPDFNKARSMLILEESARAKKAATNTDPDSAAITVDHRTGNTSTPHSTPPSTMPPTQFFQRQFTSFRGGRNGGRRGRSNRGRGRWSNGGNWPQNGGGNWQQQNGGGGGGNPWLQQTRDIPNWRKSNWAGPQQWNFGPPPCPFPSISNYSYGPGRTFNYPQAGSAAQPGLLGPRPQAHLAQEYAPTDIDAAMHTLTISQTPENWHMDTGATSHMMGGAGLAHGDPHYEMY